MIRLLVLISGEKGLTTFLQLVVAFAAQLPLYRFLKRRSARRRPFLEPPRVRGLEIPPDQF